MSSHAARSLAGGFAVFLLGSWSSAVSAEPAPDSPHSAFARGRQAVSFTSGYATAVSLRSQTKGDDVRDAEYVPINLGWWIGLSDPLGSSWYRNQFQLGVEGSGFIQTEPHSGWGAGGTLNVHWNLLGIQDDFVLFLEAGAGMMNLDFDLESQRDGFNLILQAGIGGHLFVTKRAAVTFQWRFHHISNAKIKAPNKGIDASMVLLGITVPFGR